MPDKQVVRITQVHLGRAWRGWDRRVDPDHGRAWRGWDRRVALVTPIGSPVPCELHVRYPASDVDKQGDHVTTKITLVELSGRGSTVSSENQPRLGYQGLSTVGARRFHLKINPGWVITGSSAHRPARSSSTAVAGHLLPSACKTTHRAAWAVSMSPRLRAPVIRSSGETSYGSSVARPYAASACRIRSEARLATQTCRANDCAAVPSYGQSRPGPPGRHRATTLVAVPRKQSIDRSESRRYARASMHMIRRQD
jgi:hypothetical protein